MTPIRLQLTHGVFFSVFSVGILKRVPLEQIREQYEIPAFSGATEFLTLVAAKRGKLRAGGAADHDAAARAVIQVKSSPP